MQKYLYKSKQILNSLIKRTNTYTATSYNSIQKKTPLRNSFYDPFIDQSYILSCGKNRETPLVIFDAGANKGIVTKKYKDIFPDSVIHCFEPETNNFFELNKEIEIKNLTNCFSHQLALGDSNGQIKFHITSSSTMHSALELSDTKSSPFYPPHVQAKTECNINQVTIDEFCSHDQNKIEHIHILKMDVQGYELNILKGAYNMLNSGKIEVIYSEVLFNSLYKNQCNFSQIYDFLARLNYVLFGMYDLRQGANGQIGWADAIFIKESTASKLPKDAYPLTQITGYRYDEFQLYNS